MGTNEHGFNKTDDSVQENEMQQPEPVTKTFRQKVPQERRRKAHLSPIRSP